MCIERVKVSGKMCKRIGGVENFLPCACSYKTIPIEWCKVRVLNIYSSINGSYTFEKLKFDVRIVNDTLSFMTKWNYTGTINVIYEAMDFDSVFLTLNLKIIDNKVFILKIHFVRKWLLVRSNVPLKYLKTKKLSFCVTSYSIRLL